MGSFNPKYDLKIHRGGICHENEEWCKIWKGIGLSFQNWHEKFDEFWLKHLKVSKNFILMCSFWAKYILVELKKYTGVIFHETEEGYKIFRGIESLFQNWHKEFDKIWPEHSKVSKVFISMGFFWAKYILFELKKSLEELPFMKLKRDTKFAEELNCYFKIGIRNLTKFDPSTWKPQKFSIYWAPFEQSIYCLS